MAIPTVLKEELVLESTSTPSTPDEVADVAWEIADQTASKRYLVIYLAHVKVTGTGVGRVWVEYVSAATAQPPSSMTVLGGTARTYCWWDVYDTDAVNVREVQLKYELIGTGTVEIDQCQTVQLLLDQLDEDVDYVVSKSNDQLSYTVPAGYQDAQDAFLPAASKWLVLYRQRYTGGAVGDIITGRFHQENTSGGGSQANWLATTHYFNDTTEQVLHTGMQTIDGNNLAITVRNEWLDESTVKQAKLVDNAIFALNLDKTARKQDDAGEPGSQISNTGTGGNDFPTSLGARSLFFETSVGNGLFLGSFVVHPNESGWEWKHRSEIEGSQNPTDQAFSAQLGFGPIVSDIREQYHVNTLSYLEPADGTQNYEVLAGGDTAVTPPSSAERKLLRYALSLVRLDFGLSTGTGVTVQSFPQEGGGYSTTANGGPPVWSVPGAQGITESSTLTLQASSSNAVTITEPDGATMSFALTLTNGATMALGSPGSVTGLSGDGTAAINFTATAANLDTAMEGSVVTPPVGHSVGDTYALNLSADDQHPTNPLIGNAGISLFIQAAPPPASDPQSVTPWLNWLENDVFAGGKFVR